MVRQFLLRCTLTPIHMIVSAVLRRRGFHDGGYVKSAELRKNEEAFVATDGHIVRYGRRRVDRMQAEVNALRADIRSHDTEATEAAWDKLEEWLDLSMFQRTLFRMTPRRFEVLYAIAFTDDLVTAQNRYMTFYKHLGPHPEHRLHGVNVDLICSVLRREKLIRHCRVGLGIAAYRPIITLKGIDVLLSHGESLTTKSPSTQDVVLTEQSLQP